MMRNYWILILTGLMLFFSGCSLNDRSYEAIHTIHNKYGTCIIDECRQLCGSCSFNEPECKACYSCVTYDACESQYCPK